MKTANFWNGCQLFISARSPFARRVRVAFIEGGVRYEERVFDVFKPNPELSEANPLARVPVVRFASGETVADSNQILALYWGEVGAWQDRVAIAHWSGVAVGLAEKVVEYFLETLRPEASRDQELIEEFSRTSEAALRAFERHMAGREWVSGKQLSQADIDWGCALAYYSLRYSKSWTERFPQSARFLERMESRESFKKTVPPPPA